ncbi:glycosyltransferase family 2 protein [Cellulomonas soli]|uniref:glycosyltransferase family 2 protein n=1 Tax=Cellulomonas soli TaxID=931535 RepID=UPI003F84EA5E
MTVSFSLLVAAGLDGSGLAQTIAAARAARSPGARWELVLIGRDPVPEAPGWVRWVSSQEHSTAGLLGAGLEVSRGTWVGVLGPGDQLEVGAMEALEWWLAEKPGSDVVYTDEQWQAADASGIFTKPAWNPEYERGLDYLGRLCLMRRSLLVEAGGFQADAGPAVEWDTHLRVVERTDAIDHIPVIGVTRAEPPAVDASTWDSGVGAVERHFARCGQDVRCERGPFPGSVTTWRAVPEPPLVSIVVPTGGGRRAIRGTEQVLAEMCARSLVDRTSYAPWELVLVPSEGTDPAVVQAVREIVGDRLVVAPARGPFNFSASVNTGVAAATGELVLLLNDDVEAIEATWLDRMVSVAQDPSIGVVGARLVHENGLIQHAGVVHNDEWVPVHLFQQRPDGETHFGMGLIDAEFSATTGACLLISRELFTELGGLTEELPLNYNDVDLCHKVAAASRRVVVTPLAHLHHYESSSRVPVLLPEETAHLRRYWSWRAWSDPWTNARSTR